MIRQSLDKKKNFSIVPVTPGVVYSRVESCEVLNEDESNQFSLIENRTSGTCTDWLTGFTNESGSWSTDQQQDFSFTTFKWDSTKASENQTIQCQIKLETQHDATYNPSECDQAFDECAAGTHNCDANAECTDTDDAFTCECSGGSYCGDGVSCEADGQVCGYIWQDGGRGGWKIDVNKCGLGSYDKDLHASDRGDDLTEVEVVKGCKIIVYNDKDFGGDFVTIDNTNGSENLRKGVDPYNDKGSSYQCLCA